MNYLPDEMLHEILLNCNYKDFYMFNRTCKRYNYDMKHLLIAKSKLYFPRIKHCKVFHVPSNIVKASALNYEYNPIEEESTLIALNYLLDKDLIYGDIIIIDDIYNQRRGPSLNGKLIFNGYKLLNMRYDIFPCGSIPSEFHIIENNVNIFYWGSVQYKEYSASIRVWFNHIPFRTQLIQNIKSNDELFKYKLYTTFIVNNNEYKIMSSYSYDDTIKLLLQDNVSFNNWDFLYGCHDKILYMTDKY